MMMIMQCLVFIMIKSCKQLNYPLGTLTRKRIRYRVRGEI